MRCIFCKCDSTTSRSVEHVIPESLGNTEHVLGAGVVCDRCNNYFASKVEGPLLCGPYFREQCSFAGILSKKGNLPRVKALDAQNRSVVELTRLVDGSGISVGAAYESDEERWIASVLAQKQGRIYVPRPLAPNKALMSRFLAKVALECLALRVIGPDRTAEMVISEATLDELRNYARRGPPNPVWPFHSRSLYPADALFERSDGEPFEVLHEWDFLWIGEELYFVLGLFGVEYAINFGRRDLDRYSAWLVQNSGDSPLYPSGLPSPLP